MKRAKKMINKIDGKWKSGWRTHPWLPRSCLSIHGTGFLNPFPWTWGLCRQLKQTKDFLSCSLWRSKPNFFLSSWHHHASLDFLSDVLLLGFFLSEIFLSSLCWCNTNSSSLSIYSPFENKANWWHLWHLWVSPLPSHHQSSIAFLWWRFFQRCFRPLSIKPNCQTTNDQRQVTDIKLANAKWQTLNNKRSTTNVMH